MTTTNKKDMKVKQPKNSLFPENEVNVSGNNVFSEQSDIEIEDKGDDEGIKSPFDPNKIDVDVSTINMGYLIDMLRNNEIDLSPAYQRASDLWNEKQKSRLIESILLGLPLPSFYFSEDPQTGKLSIIDGLQRICALRDFILKDEKLDKNLDISKLPTNEKPLLLTDLQFLNQFNGARFQDLGRPEVKRITGLKIVMNTLRKNTPPKVKYVIFQRVNTAGNPLTPQEMRHALNQGIPANIVKELAELNAFKLATNNSVKTTRMEDRDFINRFLGFYLWKLGLLQEYSGNLDEFLNDTLIYIEEHPEMDLKNLKTVFDRTMDICFKIFGDDAFRKRYNINDKRNPVSKSVFDTLSVNIAMLTKEEQDHLLVKKIEFKNALIELFHDNDFNDAITAGTGKKAPVEIRFEKIKQLIQNILNHD